MLKFTIEKRGDLKEISAGEDPSQTPLVHWIRNDDGQLKFFKDDGNLWSDQEADEGDEIVVLKARVRITRSTVVAVRVLREHINAPEAADVTLGRMNDEAIYAAQTLEKRRPGLG